MRWSVGCGTAYAARAPPVRELQKPDGTRATTCRRESFPGAVRRSTGPRRNGSGTGRGSPAPPVSGSGVGPAVRRCPVVGIRCGPGGPALPGCGIRCGPGGPALPGCGIRCRPSAPALPGCRDPSAQHCPGTVSRPWPGTCPCPARPAPFPGSGSVPVSALARPAPVSRLWLGICPRHGLARHRSPRGAARDAAALGRARPGRSRRSLWPGPPGTRFPALARYLSPCPRPGSSTAHPAPPRPAPARGGLPGASCQTGDHGCTTRR